MKNLILDCDFLGYTPTLYIEEDKLYRSTLSGLMSITVVILAIISTIYFGSELFFHSSPNVNYTRESYDDFSPVNISNTDFLFLFGMESANATLYSDPMVFSVIASSVLGINEINDSGQPVQTVTKSNTPMNICSLYYTQDDIIEKKLILPLDKYYCVEPNTFNISGFRGSTAPFTDTKVQFKKSQNSTENNYSFRPQKDIDDIIQNGYISIKFTNHEIDQQNYSMPLKRVFFDDYNLLNSDSSIEYAIEISNLKFNSANGLIFDNIQQYIGFSNIVRVFSKLTKVMIFLQFHFRVIISAQPPSEVI